jgi:predicted RNA-binding Zn-ribbon protein involved in translation (DUF1610 family)
MVIGMSHYRLCPTPAQEIALLAHCAHARFMWNLAVEQHSHWQPGRASAPSYNQQARQLTEARAEFEWLASGSQTVQQQALRDFHQAMAAFFRYDLIRVEDLSVIGMTRSARGTVNEPGQGVQAKAGLNRGILAAGWGQLVARLEHKAPGRVEKVKAAFTSQTCAACGHRAPKNRERQAVFRCVTCGYQVNADVNAARNIAAGRAVTARGGGRVAGPVNREPQLAPPAAV